MQHVGKGIVTLNICKKKSENLQHRNVKEFTNIRIYEI